MAMYHPVRDGRVSVLRDPGFVFVLHKLSVEAWGSKAMDSAYSLYLDRHLSSCFFSFSDRHVLVARRKALFILQSIHTVDDAWFEQYHIPSWPIYQQLAFSLGSGSTIYVLGTQNGKQGKHIMSAYMEIRSGYSQESWLEQQD